MLVLIQVRKTGDIFIYLVNHRTKLNLRKFSSLLWIAKSLERFQPFAITLFTALLKRDLDKTLISYLKQAGEKLDIVLYTHCGFLELIVFAMEDQIYIS